MDRDKKPASSDRTPFQDRINVNLFFSGAQRRKLLDEVKRALDERAAVVTITGEEGVGKSMICRMVEKELPPEVFSVYLPTPLESFDDVIRVLALEVGTDNADKPVSSKVLVDEIAAELEIRESRLVVVFDQSERMYLATIERIRKMLDRINDGAVFLQIVFAGRPSLLENLKQLAICNFKDVEERHFSLHPLGLSETYAYLNHCAQQRSSSRSKNVFTPEAAKKIYSMARGNLRMTNMLAAKSLEAAETDTSFMVLLDNVADGDQGSGKNGKKKTPVSRRQSSWRRWAYGGTGLAVLLAVAFLVFDDQVQEETENGGSAVSTESAEISPLPGEIGEEPSAPEPAEPQGTEDSAAKTASVEAEPAISPAPAESGEQKGLAAGRTGAQEQPAPEEEAHAPAAAGRSMEKAPPASAAVDDEADIAGRRGGDEPKEPAVTVSPAKKKEQEVEGPAVADAVTETTDASEQPARPAPTTTDSVDAKEERQPAVEESAVKLRQGGVAETARPEEIAQSVDQEQEEELQEESDSGEPVVFVGMKKRLPPPETDEGSAKKIAKIAPVKVKIPITAAGDDQTAAAASDDTSVDKLFDRSLARGKRWLQGQNSGSHTLQLMALTAEQAEENLKNRFGQQEYRRIADQLYIVKGNTSTVYVYYGEYEDMDSARQARNTLPLFLRKHDPYAVSVEEATAKAVSEP